MIDCIGIVIFQIIWKYIGVTPIQLSIHLHKGGNTMENRYDLNKNLAQMLKGGVIMDVTNAQEAKIAEEAGACAVMALERVPADIRKDGGVARASDPKMIKEIQAAVSIPVMAKVRIGHFVEAQILEALSVDYIDESEVLTPADPSLHIDKKAFNVPFVCGAKNLGEALRRIGEGASKPIALSALNTFLLIPSSSKFTFFSSKINSSYFINKQLIKSFFHQCLFSPQTGVNIVPAAPAPEPSHGCGSVDGFHKTVPLPAKSPMDPQPPCAPDQQAWPHYLHQDRQSPLWPKLLQRRRLCERQ